MVKMDKTVSLYVQWTGNEHKFPLAHLLFVISGILKLKI